MKILYFSFSLLLLFSCLVVESFSQSVAEQFQHEDWSALFPEIPHCERVIQPLKQKGEIFEQTAVYEREDYQKFKNQPHYFGCGSITIRSASLARKAARENFAVNNFPMTQKFQIKTFEAYRNSPLCGNDISIGSIEVYFDEDKVLIVHAFVRAHKILDFAQNADYDLMKESMNRLINDKTKRKYTRHS